MLNHLQLQYRSFKNACFEKLSEINILVGPNNTGKSSVFQALYELSEYFQKIYNQSPEEIYGFEPWKRYQKSPGINSLFGSGKQTGRELGKGLSNSHEITIEFLANDLISSQTLEEVRIGFIFDSEKSHPHYYIREKEQKNFTPEPLIQKAQGYKDSEIWGHPGETPKLPRYSLQSLVSPSIQFNRPQISDEAQSVRKRVVDFLRGVFFLSHHRASLWEREVLALDRLDSRAQDLASRIDQLIVEDAQFRDRLNQFMNTVLPGIGEIKPARTSSSQDGRNPMVAISFETQQGANIPLKHSGGGVEQILAIATVLLGEPQATLLLLEEPESHLEEGAQRRLIQQISEHRGNRQIIISTHSPVFMNGFPDATVYRLTKPQSESRVDKCLSLKDQHQILDYLGTQPSTLLQSNFVICVEGPTEVILFRHWIRLLAPELREKEHFLFHMTAGSLLSYYSVDPNQKHLTNLFSICRNISIVCDKDACEKDAVARLRSELKSISMEDYMIITDFYEIEWYYPKKAVENLWDLRSDIVNTLFTPKNQERPFFEVLLEVGQEKAKLKTAGKRKAEWAKQVTSDETLTAKDWFGPGKNNLLAQKVRQLVNLILKAN